MLLLLHSLQMLLAPTLTIIALSSIRCDHSARIIGLPTAIAVVEPLPSYDGREKLIPAGYNFSLSSLPFFSLSSLLFLCICLGGKPTFQVTSKRDVLRGLERLSENLHLIKSHIMNYNATRCCRFTSNKTSLNSEHATIPSKTGTERPFRNSNPTMAGA